MFLTFLVCAGTTFLPDTPFGGYVCKGRGERKTKKDLCVCFKIPGQCRSLLIGGAVPSFHLRLAHEFTISARHMITACFHRFAGAVQGPLFLAAACSPLARVGRADKKHERRSQHVSDGGGGGWRAGGRIRLFFIKRSTQTKERRPQRRRDDAAAVIGKLNKKLPFFEQ